MSNDKMPVVDMRWLANGEPDQFADYLKRNREDMPMADFSDDELANAAFMHYGRAPEVEMAMMVKHHEEKTLHLFHSRIGIMTAVKERLRWLSRRVAVLEGRYPGVPSPVNKLDELNRVCKERSLILEISYEHAKDGWWSNWTEGYHELGALVDLVLKEIHNTDQEHVIEASQPNIAVTFELKGVLKTPEDLPKEGSRGEVWKVGGTFYVWDEVTEKFTSSHEALRGVNIQADGIGQGDLSQTPYRNIIIDVQAEKIYNTWFKQEGWVPWVKNGNSNKQKEARAEARQKLEKFFSDSVTQEVVNEVISPDLIQARKTFLELSAKSIHNGWVSEANWTPWIENGNGVKQSEARLAVSIVYREFLKTATLEQLNEKIKSLQNEE